MFLSKLAYNFDSNKKESFESDHRGQTCQPGQAEKILIKQTAKCSIVFRNIINLKINLGRKSSFLSSQGPESTTQTSYKSFQGRLGKTNKYTRKI